MKTYWNGMQTQAEKGTAVVADCPEAPAYWARDIVGERIEVVRVQLDGVNYGGGEVHLDDRLGLGWAKVTSGMGSPALGHREVEVVPGSFVAAEVQR